MAKIKKQKGQTMIYKTLTQPKTPRVKSGTLATNPVISHEWGKDRRVITTNRELSQVL